jgi:hypothetical protein
VMKTRCALRRRDGARVDVWFVLYRADAEPEPDAPPPTVLPARDAGASITPAPLVFQIRVADAQTIMPGAAGLALEGGSVPLEGSVPSSSSSSSSSSSLAGAVPPLFPGGANAAEALSEDDMFDALAVARGSSWQYELQQLRITNLRLREELAALEAAEAAAAAASGVVEAPQPAQGMGYEAALYEPQQQQHQQPHQLHPHARVYVDPAPPPPPPLFTSQPQHPHPHVHRDPYSQQLHYDYEPPPLPLPPPHPPYLHQPVPLAQYVVPLPPTQQQRGGPRCETPQEWNTVQGYGAGLKRAWSAIDRA